MPINIMFMAWFFCTTNGYLQVHQRSSISHHRAAQCLERNVKSLSLHVAHAVQRSSLAALQGRAVSHFVEYDATEFISARFMVGTALFFLGLLINIHSDSILFNLRKPGDTQRYKVS